MDGVRLTYPPVKEFPINVRAVDNRGNYTVRVGTSYILLLLRIFSDDTKSTLAKSRVTVSRIYKYGMREIFRYTVVDEVDSEFIVEDASNVPVTYEIVIAEKGVALEGVVKYV
jgi:hypothetical protein